MQRLSKVSNRYIFYYIMLLARVVVIDTFPLAYSIKKVEISNFLHWWTQKERCIFVYKNEISALLNENFTEIKGAV